MLTINVLCPGLCTSPAVATTSYPNKSLEFDWTIWVSSQRNIQVGFFVWLVVDNKKPPPMSTVHTHTSWDWPMTHHEEHWPLPCPHMGDDAGYGQETSADNHRLPLCSFVQQSSKWQDRTFNTVMCCDPHKAQAAVIKHFQPRAWAGPWVREGCKPCGDFWQQGCISQIAQEPCHPFLDLSDHLWAVSLLQVGGQWAGPARPCLWDENYKD